VLDFFTLTSRTHASPPGLLHVRENDPNYLSTVQEEVPPACIVIGFSHFVTLVNISEVRLFFFLIHTDYLHYPQYMTGRFVGKSDSSRFQ
jgi:hypothetical protein